MQGGRLSSQKALFGMQKNSTVLLFMLDTHLTETHSIELREPRRVREGLGGSEMDQAFTDAQWYMELDFIIKVTAP